MFPPRPGQYILYTCSHCGYQAKGPHLGCVLISLHCPTCKSGEPMEQQVCERRTLIERLLDKLGKKF